MLAKRDWLILIPFLDFSSPVLGGGMIKSAWQSNMHAHVHVCLRYTGSKPVMG